MGDLRHLLRGDATEVIFVVIEEWEEFDPIAKELGWDCAWWVWFPDGNKHLLRAATIKEKSRLLQRIHRLQNRAAA